MAELQRLTVRGFKSIRELEKFELRKLNVLIGANGAGKSNFIGLFRLISALMEKRLQLHVAEQDGPDALLFRRRKHTSRISIELEFDPEIYRAALQPAGEQLIFASEEVGTFGQLSATIHHLGDGHEEAKVGEPETARVSLFAPFVREAVSRWREYHFHDTSASAAVRNAQAVRDNVRLKEDAGNLAPFLRLLREQHEHHYRRIVETIRMVAPFFGDFFYRETPGRKVDLEWVDINDPDTPWGPRQLSDGTLRFICLATLLLQPPKFQPDIILIDEPELGLHPFALATLGALLRQVSESKRIVVATQSVELVNEFAPEDIVVVGQRDGASTFDRLDPEQLSDWLKDYSLGELWKMNVIGGRPTR